MFRVGLVDPAAAHRDLQSLGDTGSRSPVMFSKLVPSPASLFSPKEGEIAF